MGMGIDELDETCVLHCAARIAVENEAFEFPFHDTFTRFGCAELLGETQLSVWTHSYILAFGWTRLWIVDRTVRRGKSRGAGLLMFALNDDSTHHCSQVKLVICSSTTRYAG